MFKPFTRETSGDKHEASSMGLGLSIANNFIKSMNGRVDVESEVGQGSTFKIHIELKPFDENAMDGDMEKIVRTKEISFVGRHILVADDNPLNRKILGALLSIEGMTYVEVCDGEEAYETFVNAPAKTYDCILMDMRMPKLDGIKATAKIRDCGKSDAKSISIFCLLLNIVIFFDVRGKIISKIISKMR